MKGKINLRKVATLLVVAIWSFLGLLSILWTIEDLVLGKPPEFSITLLLLTLFVILSVIVKILKLVGVHVNDKAMRVINYIFLVGCVLGSLAVIIRLVLKIV